MSKHKNDSKLHGESAVSSANPEGASVAPDAAAVSGVAAADAKPSGAAVEAPAKGGGGKESTEGAGSPDALAAELGSAQAQIASLRSEVDELNEKYLRKLADEVNFRKRMVREKEEAQKYAVASLLGDLIPILDDFDRGIASVESTKNYEQLCEGVVLIRKQLSQMLENKYALMRFESKGAPFDPNRHEALFAEPADVEDPMVADEYLPGYSLHDRILRTAKVRVRIPNPAKPARVPESASDTSASESDGPADAAGRAQ
ncbi:MAG TPA: nucleotide exchange factor GrpE [Rectinemataceae bacterium]|nr:nucleotide exchange factor GrpE [Rectinemataceae bacterium]